tara:strand:+ start:5229 stop:5951 length:723 start_codon:yes stop_codon:yes gene_type:complete
MLPIVVLAGGEGTRLKNIQKNSPKVLKKINKTPFIDLLIENLIRLGFRDLIFILHKDQRKIKLHLNNQKYLNGVKLNFFYDGEENLGTAGSIVKNINNLPDIFWTTYGDTLLNWDVEASESKFISSNYDSLMTVINKKFVNESPNLLIQNEKIYRYSKNDTKKNNYVDYGAILFNKSVFLKYQVIKFGLEIVFKDLIKTNKIDYFETFNKFYEIGNPASFNEVEKALKYKNIYNLWSEIE